MSTQTADPTETRAASVLARNWWMLAVRGVLAIAFGALAFVWPGITLAALVLLFGAYAAADGVFALAGAVRAAGNRRRWWPLLLEGLAGVGAGIVAFVWPGITALALLYLVAAWAIITGAFELYAAVKLRRSVSNEWLLALSGVASVVFGVLLVALPGPGILTLLWLVGAYAIVFGVLLVALAFRMRGVESPKATRAPT
ncbi:MULTISPECIES: HdeD family acid-resistance protein [Halorussus]|uniref:HdeD family acid-resistance protein n=1 Tax=Halorussus TaxID=1070314 RepID=UPI00209C9ADE|nr:HdeD family acid-resistance protein [Halorussus vallis]USZ78117.1 HdeD family acid-resistance protein [Halorussus vallis]